MNKVIMLAVVFLALGVFAGATARAGDSATDAFLLAMQHFDPQSERGIAWSREEMDFVDFALMAAIRAVHELASVHIESQNATGAAPRPQPLLSLQVLDPISRNPQLRGDWDYVQDFVAAVVDGCGSSRVTEEFDNARDRWSKRQTTTWRICDEWNHANADTSCNRSAAAAWLCAAGVASMLIETMESDRGPESGQLYLNFSQPVDLRHEASRIVGLPGYGELFGKARLQPYPSMISGDGNRIELVQDEDCQGFGGITLLFSHGWGDCPSGCIHRHYWKVKVQSRGSRNGDPWGLVVTKVEEAGDVLALERRAALCAGIIGGD